MNEGELGPLTLVEQIRKRPGMYIGELDPHPLLWEVVGNSIDVELGGRPVHVEVEIHADGSMSVEDDGPGIGLTLEALMVEGHFSPTADGHSPHVHLNGWGFGLAVVCALSERVEIRTRRGEVMVRQHFARGRATSELECEVEPARFGTRVRFWPDPSVFGRFRWDPTAIRARLHELVAPRAQLSCRLVVAPTSFAASLDIADLIPEVAGQPTLHDDVIRCRASADGVTARVALQWHARDRWSKPSIRSFCNLRETSKGKHVMGFERGIGVALARVVPGLAGEPWRRVYELVKPGVAAVVAVEMIDPTFLSPIRDNPVNPELANVVQAAILDVVPAWLERHPDVVTELVRK